MAKDGDVPLIVLGSNSVAAMDKFDPDGMVGWIELETGNRVLMVDISEFDDTTTKTKSYMATIKGERRTCHNTVTNIGIVESDFVIDLRIRSDETCR